MHYLYKRVACLAVFIVLGFSLIFHEQVYAAINSFTTKISEILQLSNNLTSYTDAINLVKEKNGVSVALNEAILMENGLIVSVKVDEKQENPSIGVGVSESIRINNKKYTCSSSDIYQKKNLDNRDDEYVIQWNFDEELPVQKKMNIEMEILVHKDVEDIEGESFLFSFTSSQEELQKNTLSYNLNKKITLDGTQAVIKKITINNVMSTIEIECNKLNLDDKEYYIRLRDDKDNEFVYELYRKDGKRYSFKNIGDNPSLKNVWLDGRVCIIQHNSIKNSEKIGGEQRDIFEINKEKMIPISNKFRIILKRT